jgi:hypothetical protein
VQALLFDVFQTGQTMSQNLGKPVAWQIRDMPEAVRDIVVEQARVEGVKVPDLLTRLLLEAQARGWSMADYEARAGQPGADPSRLQFAVEMAVRLGESDKAQKGVTALANRLVKRELLKLDADTKRVAPAPAPAPKMLKNEFANS